MAASAAAPRVLLAPCSAAAAAAAISAPAAFPRHFLHLRHPVSGSPACFVVAPDGCLLELHWSKQRHTAWFIANSVCADGSLYLATPVDPLFAILPILEQLRRKNKDDMGRFRSLDDIVSVDGYPSYGCLFPYLQRSLEIICESREVEEVKFYRLDDSKVIAWLLCKVTRLTEALKTSSSLLNGLHPNERDLYVIKLLGEYLKMDFWESSICQHMGVDIDALKTARVSFTPSMPVPSRTPERKVNKLNGPAAKKAALTKNSKQSGASPKITSYFTSNR